MGLDTTHGCWHSPYSSFQEWRCEIAKAAGYELENLGYTYVPLISQKWLTKEAEYGEWKKTPKDPLIVLFAHSDCEGVIHPEQGRALADRLEELIDRLPEDEEVEVKDWMDFGTLFDANRYREKTQRFIDGLRLAAELGEDVEFL